MRFARAATIGQIEGKRGNAIADRSGQRGASFTVTRSWLAVERERMQLFSFYFFFLSLFFFLFFSFLLSFSPFFFFHGATTFPNIRSRSWNQSDYPRHRVSRRIYLCIIRVIYVSHRYIRVYCLSRRHLDHLELR